MALIITIMQLADAANPPLVIEAESVTMGGASLEDIYEWSNAREVIGTGDYGVVILQGALFRTDVDTFHEYVSKFDAEIKETEAETVLFMAWH